MVDHALPPYIGFEYTGWIRRHLKMAWRGVSSVKLALCQIKVGADKALNLKTAECAIRKAWENGAQIISLPECWNSPYATSAFPAYAEEIPETVQDVTEAHPSTQMMTSLSKELGIYLVGGSIPEREPIDNNVYNTCIVADPEGKIIAKHRKMHLFDIDVPGKITFKESDTLSSGNDLVVFDTKYCRVGLGICYDIRFPEFAQALAEKGAHVLLYPGAFNMTTGPAHWELLQRARAVDNQLFVATTSPARNTGEDGYQAWGHSSVVNPWGDVIATTDETPSIVYADLELEKIDEMRKNIPTRQQKRRDIYQLQLLG